MKLPSNFVGLAMAALGPEKLFAQLRKEAFWKGIFMGVLIGICLCYIFMEISQC